MNRWGIIGTGLISSWFTKDLLLDRPDAKVDHKITAIGASEKSKGEAFKEKFQVEDATVGTYDEVYENNDVDIIYIGLPHVFHKEHAIKAMNAGKHVLVEKPACINAADFEELIEVAKKNNVFLMEAVWLRFKPLFLDLQNLLLKEKHLGEIYRLIGDFAMDMALDLLPSDSRIKNVNLGAGSLLDIGLYPLTYARGLLDDKLGKEHEPFEVKSFQTVHHGIDYLTSAIVKYDSQKQAIISSSVYNKTPEDFLRIECELGTVIVGGFAASNPKKYRIEYKDQEKETVFKEYAVQGFGFYYEADSVANSIAAGKLENEIMPWEETLLMLRTMDAIRKDGGVVYPQDK